MKVRSFDDGSEVEYSVKKSQMTQAIEPRNNNNMLICETPLTESVENGINLNANSSKILYKR